MNCVATSSCAGMVSFETTPFIDASAVSAEEEQINTGSQAQPRRIRIGRCC
jgi:hypothetical protein